MIILKPNIIKFQKYVAINSMKYVKLALQMSAYVIYFK